MYTGLRSGEKLREELLGDGEEDRRPNHPLITQAEVPALNLAMLNGVLHAKWASQMREMALGGPSIESRVSK